MQKDTLGSFIKLECTEMWLPITAYLTDHCRKEIINHIFHNKHTSYQEMKWHKNIP